jgi:hypothetical protein
MHRILIALAVTLALSSCTSSYDSIIKTPVAEPTPPQPRLFEQHINPGDYRIPVLHATAAEFYSYQRELLTAPLATQRSVRGIICYASKHDVLDPVMLARIKELYGNAMAEECGKPTALHWGSEAATRCLPGAGVVAHCHGNGVICVIADRQYDGSLRHEALHALLFAQRPDDFQRWRLTWLETLYVGGLWSKMISNGTSFPRDGFTDQYAMKDYDEDMARVVEAAAIFAHRTEWTTSDYYYGADLQDPRWRLKLKAVRGFDAITDDEEKAVDARLTPPP